MDTTVVVAGGPSPSPADRTALIGRLADVTPTRIVAADSGVELLDALGVDLLGGRDVVVGDMDSIDPDRLDRAIGDGVRVERFPTDKDATDLELALDDARAHAGSGERIVVVGTRAGRFDHVLAMLATLASDRYDGVVREAWLGSDVVHVITQGSVTVTIPSGGVFSILPIHGDARGVTATGVRWELHGETLRADTSRGISNQAADGPVVVGCTGGTVLVVVPGEVAS